MMKVLEKPLLYMRIFHTNLLCRSLYPRCDEVLLISHIHYDAVPVCVCVCVCADCP
jgi:hypothetical protein